MTGSITLPTADGGEETVELDDAPALAAALIRRGRTTTARSVIDIWFVAQCEAAGITDWELRPK